MKYVTGYILFKWDILDGFDDDLLVMWVWSWYLDIWGELWDSLWRFGSLCEELVEIEKINILWVDFWVVVDTGMDIKIRYFL